jgi:hypothetical protein
VVRALVFEDFVFHACLLEGFLVGRNRRIDPIIQRAEMLHETRLDLRGVVELRRDPVIGHRGIEIRRLGREDIDHPAAPAEADDANFQLRVFSFQIGDELGERFTRLVEIDLREHGHRGVDVLRRPALRQQKVWRHRDEAFEGKAAGNILNMRIQTAIFVNRDDERVRRVGFRSLRRREVSLDARGRVLEFRGIDAWVFLVDDGRAGIVRGDHLDRGFRRAHRADHCDEAFHERAPAKLRVSILVVKFDDPLVHVASSSVSACLSPAAAGAR